MKLFRILAHKLRRAPDGEPVGRTIGEARRSTERLAQHRSLRSDDGDIGFDPQYGYFGGQ